MKKQPNERNSKKESKNYLREAFKDKNMSLVDMIHGYIYLRWPKEYIGAALGRNKFSPMADFLAKIWGANSSPEKCKKLKKEFAESYHGKVIPLDEATKLVTLNRDVNTTVSEKVLPYTRARDIILKNPEQIVLMECPCRASVENPCKPLDVCMIIGEPFASFIAEHHPDKARRITAKEAVRVLEMEDARGHVHHAFFKDVMLGRFYALCNCCSCCCGAIQATKNGIPMLAPSGYLAIINRRLCVGCGQCIQYCQFEALSIKKNKSHVDPGKCMGCGVCVNKCFKEAIHLARSPKSGEPLKIEEL